MVIMKTYSHLYNQVVLFYVFLVMSKRFPYLTIALSLEFNQKNEVFSFYVFLKNFSMIPIFLIP